MIGYGVVGSGIVGLLHKNAATIAARAGEQIEVRYILDLRDFPESPYGAKHIKDFNLILADESIGVVMEAIGGINPAYQFTKALLKAGKSVVTSNKELVANKGAELLSIARAHGGNYLFEASVGGAIPIIRPLSACLAANEI